MSVESTCTSQAAISSGALLRVRPQAMQVSACQFFYIDSSSIATATDSIPAARYRAVEQQLGFFLMYAHRASAQPGLPSWQLVSSVNRKELLRACVYEAAQFV